MDQEFYIPSYCLRYRYRTCHGDGEYVNVNISHSQAAARFASMEPKHIHIQTTFV